MWTRTLALLVLICGACGERVEPAPATMDVQQTPREKKAEMSTLQEALQSELEVVPGKSIGPLALGMRADAVRALGVSLTQEPPSPPRVYIGRVGPVRVVLREDVVASIEIDVASTAGLRVAGTLLPIKGSLEDIAKVFPGCGTLELLEGGRLVRCGGGHTLLKQGSGETGGVTLQVLQP